MQGCRLKCFAGNALRRIAGCGKGNTGMHFEQLSLGRVAANPASGEGGFDGLVTHLRPLTRLTSPED